MLGGIGLGKRDLRRNGEVLNWNLTRGIDNVVRGRYISDLKRRMSLIRYGWAEPETPSQYHRGREAILKS